MKWIKTTFWIGALYDGILGLAFLFAGHSIFAHFEVPPPNHPGYLQFPALLLIIFAILASAIVQHRHDDRVGGGVACN